MSHGTLENYYKTMYAMTKRGHNGTWLEDQLVFEKDIYVTMQVEESKKHG